MALLSFSTAGSADHPSLTKLHEALALIRAAEPDLEIDGEVQFDAALDDAIRAKKAPHSRLSGRPANLHLPRPRLGQYRLQDRAAQPG